MLVGQPSTWHHDSVVCGWTGEGSHTDRSDLIVPLALACEIVGVARWLEGAG
jgi:hypothetical protein